MKERLISFKTAKLAKEKGFNEECHNFYAINDDRGWHKDGELLEGFDDDYWGNNYEHNWNNGTIPFKPFCHAASAPIQSSVQTWLRNKHNIHIVINVSSAGDGEEKIKWFYSYVTGIHNCLSDEAFGCVCDEEFNSYEDALEEALFVTLNLIFIE